MSKYLLNVALGAVVAAAALEPIITHAGSAEICYSPVEQLSNCSTPSGCDLPVNSTIFQCPTAGNKTVPELAAEGWLVVQIAQRIKESTTGNQVEQLVIQKP